MSRFFSAKYEGLKAYTPGEQPRERLIKLNTNESPYPPDESVAAAAADAARRLNLYCDTECAELKARISGVLGVRPEQIIATNGSDEALNFAFMAFCDAEHPAVFPDITYGFYPVFARINRVPYREIPLREDWTVNPADYAGCGGTVFLANPNAPTGLALTIPEIEEILRSNPDSVVVVDEAYVDFGGETALPLLERYENLLVTRTFSKSRSMAGLRLGFAVGNEELIRDLKTMQFSTNPYNVDALAQAAGAASLAKDEVNRRNMAAVRETRERTRERLEALGFETTDSRANFLFVRHPAFPGSALRDRLRERGILIRWFDQDRIRDWSRISIGSGEEMDVLIRTITELTEV